MNKVLTTFVKFGHLGRHLEFFKKLKGDQSPPDGRRILKIDRVVYRPTQNHQEKTYTRVRVQPPFLPDYTDKLCPTKCNVRWASCRVHVCLSIWYTGWAKIK